MPYFAVPAYGPQNDVTLKMPAFEWVHVQLHQQKGMISLSPPTICNSATSTTTCCRPRSSPHSSASRPCPGDQPEQRPVRKSVCSCWTSSWPPSPAGQGQRAARCHPHRVRAENHPAGCGGAGSGAGADRPNQPVTAAHQDHRTADGRGRLDGLQPPLHPLEGRGRGQRQDVAAVRNPR